MKKLWVEIKQEFNRRVDKVGLFILLIMVLIMLLPIPQCYAADFSTIAYEERQPGMACTEYVTAVREAATCSVIVAGTIHGKYHAIVCKCDYSECADNYITARGMTYPLEQFSRRMENMIPEVQVWGGVAVARHEDQLILWR